MWALCVSLAGLVVPCLVPSLAGICLGVASLPGARARGDLRGWRRGWVATLVGIVGLLGWTWALEWVRTSTNQHLERRLLVVMQQLTDPAIAPRERASVLGMGADQRPPQEALDHFAQEASARYGALKWLSIASSTPEGTLLDPIFSSSVTLQFGRGERLGAIRFRLVPGDPVEPAIVEATILDGQAGNLTLVPTSATGATP